MRLKLVLALAAVLAFAANGSAQTSPAPASPLTLWYASAATKWTEALPVGNGYMGAMVFGEVFDERIQFNEDTLWKGKPHDYVRKGAADQLAEIRRLVFEGKADEAGKLAKEKAISDPVRQMPYQPFGDLRLHFAGNGQVKHYRRELDLDSAIARVSYRLLGVNYKREIFASYPDRAIVVRLTADTPGAVSFTLGMDSPHTNTQTRAIARDTLAMKGRLGPDGLKFESRVRVVCDGGKVHSTRNEVVVENADSATIYLVAATSFKNFQDISASPAWRCRGQLNAVSKKKFSDVLAAHLADYGKLFHRFSLILGETNAASALPTDERLMRVKADGLAADPALAALYVQYGRYLLIASSRPGSQPANLQGVWNEELNPPWESKYTLNINAEMNYWPAEIGNLSECHEPLFDLIDDLAISGARAAKEQYRCRGWVVHHNTDLWRGAAPINNVDGFWPTGGAWLCHHLWEHYLFTSDTNFLKKRAYPAMKSASLFFVDFLVKDPKTGYLVTCPSHSPEQTPPNRPLFAPGPTMDDQLIRQLFTHTIDAAEILGTDKEFADKLAGLRAQLPPNQVGSHGQLQEWLEDWDAPNNNHRHMSPLWGLYPGCDITPADTNVFAAAKVLLTWRGDGSTGWSYAWRMPLWARAGDGDFAFRQFDGLLQRRTLPNLFDLCGPFQIDGNFGASAGVMEMLLQSQLTVAAGILPAAEPGFQPGGESADSKKNVETSGVAAGSPAGPDGKMPPSTAGRMPAATSGIRILDLLPALPKAWPNGSVKGLRARGGFEVDIAWRDGKLASAIVRSDRKAECRIRYGGKAFDATVSPGRPVVLSPEL